MAQNAAAQRPLRADAQRNLDALLEAAKAVFEDHGVDAPAKQITDLAGVGVGTLYRHFPQRSDLVSAVLTREIDACADAATVLLAELGPVDALTTWLDRVTDLVATKRGLAKALHSGDAAFEGLSDFIWSRLEPALDALLVAGRASGSIREDVAARDILVAVAQLSVPTSGQDSDFSRRMVLVFTAGLRPRAQ